MSYSELNNQVVLTMSREDAQREVLRLLRAFDDRKMKADFDRWYECKFRKPRLHSRLNSENPNYTPMTEK